MRSSALALATAAVLAGCGGSAPPPQTGGSNNVSTIPVGCGKFLGESSGLDATQTTTQHFASVQVGTPLSIDVPANTVSLTVIEQAVTAPDVITEHTSSGTQVIPNTAVPLTIKDPGGLIVHDDKPSNTIPDPTQAPSLFASESPAAGTLTIPNTSAGLAGLPLRPGAWSVLVSDYAYECATKNLLSTAVTCDESSTTSTYDVTVITKQSPAGIPATGTIDFTFYFATAQAPDPLSGTTNLPLSAANAEAGKDPALARVVQSLGVILGRAGLAIGTVRWVDLPQDVQATLDAGINVDVRGACAELPQLLARAQPGNTANIFFVSRLTGGTAGSFNVVGVDGTIPGPASVGGTVASGAAVSTEDLRAGSSSCTGTDPVFFDPLTGKLGCGADEVAFIVAHEMGHFLGLYHVTEQEGLDFDTLGDTPRCPCNACKLATGERCLDNTTSTLPLHLMTTVECTRSVNCQGGDNLMFWLFGSQAKATLSPEQQRVMRANPLVR